MRFGTFAEMFEKATGHAPYPYQVRMATAAEIPSLVSVPTGLGKTAAAIAGWAWRRRFAGDETRHQTPRRLVYCLPMRVLVEQTRDCAVRWLRNLDVYAENAPAEHPADKIGVHVLMGGDVERDWDRWPDRDQILIGTQDMLLSRALNRGYALSRFRWPVQFGLLNSDCLWVMDEVQLMGNGLATTAQLQAFRRKLGTVGAARSMWMSATMRPAWLSTVDFDLEADAPGTLAIEDDDRSVLEVEQRLTAHKSVAQVPESVAGDAAKEAKLVLKQHVPHTLTLVVVNTVKRAVALHQAIAKRPKDAEVLLLHSRFRAPDRKRLLDTLFSPVPAAGRIVVSTQVVEAGVDISAQTLFTDLAPWSSLVQRFGRCNREGKISDAAILWFDVGKATAPYTAEEIAAARQRIVSLTDAAPAKLPPVDSDMRYTHVVRRKDVVELFDTTPDLAGADVDVSRFIRESDEHDVQVFWRDIPQGEEPQPEEPGPSREELCRVPIGDFRDWLSGKGSGRTAWRWDHLAERWLKVDSVFPGLVLMLRAADGGYSSERGWAGDKRDAVAPISAAERTASERVSADPRAASPWRSLADHTNDVVAEVERLRAALGPILAEWARAVEMAARWHDVGKAHPQFQGAVGPAPRPGVWGKAPSLARYRRRGFRHELASALAVLTLGDRFPETDRDLVAYLVAAHHGKVRLSIRSLPGEMGPGAGRRFARGIHDGDALPEVDLGGGVSAPTVMLSLEPMELGLCEEAPFTGQPSWAERMIRLRDDVGSFRLAYLESLLRAADCRASRNAEERA